METGQVFPATHRGYTQTDTFMFRGCRNKKAFMSPSTKEGMEELKHVFVAKLVESGFEVTGENGPHGFEYDVMCRGFGPDCAVTMVAILSGSDATIHGYGEEEFGVSVELELNLCYLPNRRDHSFAVEKSVEVFKKWLGARSVERMRSKRRMLKPIPQRGGKKRKGGAA